MTHGADATPYFEERIPVDLAQPVELEIRNPGGDVTVRAGDRDDVLVSRVSAGNPASPGADEAELMIDVRQNQISVWPRPRAGGGWAGLGGDSDLAGIAGQIAKAFRAAGPWLSAEAGKNLGDWSGDDWPDIIVEVPRDVTGRVAVNTASGDIRIEGVTSDLTLNSMSGDVRVTDATGTMALNTASGDLVIDDAHGSLTARSASGDVRVSSARIDGFQIQTASGDILFDAMLAGVARSSVQTVSGDVHLALRPAAADGEETGATLSLHTVSGEATVSPPFRRSGRGHWQAGAGHGGPRIDVKTVSGDLVARIAAAESAFDAAARPAAPTRDDPRESPEAHRPTDGDAETAMGMVMPDAVERPPEPADSARLALLAAVERGEIDIEEALRRLEAVDSSASV